MRLLIFVLLLICGAHAESCGETHCLVNRQFDVS